MEIKPAWLLVGSAAAALLVFLKSRGVNRPSEGGRGASIEIAKLVDPIVREDHLAFNQELLDKFPSDDAIYVSGAPDGSDVYLVHRHERVMEVINDHQTFSSNPWFNRRGLVTLNTMERSEHDRVYRLLKKYYSSAAIQALEGHIHEIVVAHGNIFERDQDAFKFSKRLHMHLSLLTSGLSTDCSPTDTIIDEFITWNDAAVRLAAPLGGVGTKPILSLERFLAVCRGVGKSLREVWGLIHRVGLIQSWKLIDPIESLFPSFPFTHCWDYPEYMFMIPQYFNRLYDCMSVAQADTPAGALFHGIGRSISAAESIATAVQLMVNMTTANAIMSLLYRRCSQSSITPDDILRLDAPLQRNPRRAKRAGRVGSVHIKKGSLLLLMLGSANTSCPSAGVMTTFGFGLHHCLGRHLVQIEMRLIDEWIGGRDCKLISFGRLSDVDVGNWGFSELLVRI